MRFFLPPYSKAHIVIIGSITLLVGVGLLGLLTKAGEKQHQNGPTQAITASAESIKKDFKEPLAMAQQGKFDTAWANTGFLLIDIRSAEEYQQAHIEGALSTPLPQLKYAVFSENTKLVIYSDSEKDLNQALATLGEMKIETAHTLTASLADLESKGYIITKAEK